MAFADKERGKAYNAEWARTHPESRRASAKKWRAAHRDEWNAYQREWREKTHDHSLEWHRRNYEKHREEILARRRAERAAHRDEINAKKRALYAERKRQQQQEESMMELEKCPLCGSAGAVRIGGSGYVWGCTKKKCEKWIGRPDADCAPTMECAAGLWNEWCGETAKAMEDDVGAREEERGDVGDVAGEPPEEPAEGEAADAVIEAMVEDGNEEDEEPEEGVRFWVEVDGVWYWLEEGEATCDGCAFLTGIGRRKFCAAGQVEGLKAASDLCEKVKGVFREQEE